MKWLYKLEYKFGKYYIRNLMLYIVGGMFIAYAAELLFGYANVMFNMIFVRELVLQGQVWRLITFIFVPDFNNLIMMMISLFFYYFIGNSLERMWGGFRFNLYYFVGILGAIAAGFLTPNGIATNYYLNLSLLLAFATLAPDTEFRLFFFLPIKAKWMGIAYAIIMAADLIRAFLDSPTEGLSMLIILAFSLLNYAIFFGRDFISGVKTQIMVLKNRRNWRNRNR